MKKYQYLIILISFFIIVIVNNPSIEGLKLDNYHTMSFNPSENTLYVGGNGPGNYTRIQDAINDALDGDTVFVFDDSSPYFENIIIDKSLSLIGEKSDTTVIDGSQLNNVVEINANHVNISGFTISNCSKGSSAGLWGYTNFSTITNNNIISNNWCGLSLRYSHFNKISNNFIKDNFWLGILLYMSNDNLISQNTIISNNNEGYVQSLSHRNKISGNTISKHENGIYILKDFSENIVSGNIILLNEYGIRLSDAGDNNRIISNSIRFNMYGVVLEYSYSNMIENNNFFRNIFSAYFDTFYDHEDSTNYWNGNYWNRPRVLPKLIYGAEWQESPFSRIFDLAIDRNPALFPNKITPI